LPDETGFPHKGKLDFLDNRFDQGTGTLRARAIVSNKSGLFSPGLFARVRVTGTPQYAALLVPDEAIATDQSLKYVYVVAGDGVVARRNVQLGPLEAGLRVVREGIAAEDWVVVRGLQRARPGIKVDMKQTSIALSPVSPVNKTAE
jgi:multidrug efflux system membrane fusion protein